MKHIEVFFSARSTILLIRVGAALGIAIIAFTRFGGPRLQYCSLIPLRPSLNSTPITSKAAKTFSLQPFLNCNQSLQRRD